MRHEYEIREYLDTLCESSEERGVLEWVLESPTEPKFNVGEFVMYNGYERDILKYDGSDNSYLICWFVHDVWVSECELSEVIV